MKNPLHNELEDLGYISISSIDPYDIPESVVIYFKNNSEVNKRMSIETIHGTQLDLQNQNPSLRLINNKAVFCLTPPSLLECIPTVSEVSCLCLDLTKNYRVTVDDETFSGSFEDVALFLSDHGLYAYSSETKCNPCVNAVNSFTITRVRWNSEAPQ